MKKLYILSAVVSLISMAGCSSWRFADCADENAAWHIVIENLSNPDEIVTLTKDDACAPQVRKNSDGKTVSFASVGDRKIQVSIKYLKSDDGEGMDIVPSITNNEEGWVVSSFHGPEVKGFLNGAPENYSLITPRQKGHKTNLAELKAVSSKHKVAGDWDWGEDEGCYVSGIYGNMKFCTFEGDGEGVYVGVKDKDFKYRTAGTAHYFPDSDEMVIANSSDFFCHPGESVELSAQYFWHYTGDWHVAADRYREWYTANHTIAVHPKWLRNTTGWMLTILKQQNAEVIWPYSTIGREMSDAAEANGFNLLGLFGRAKGGHDRFYPNYDSDPEMGGEEEFKKGIAEAHARGLKAIVYCNGQLLDRNGIDNWWEETGKNISLVDKNGEVYGENFQKFHNGSDRSFTWACMHAKEWKDKLWEFAVKANELGADGLIYDQCGGFAYRRCYSKDHGHKSPDFAYGSDLYLNLENIYNGMQKINPEFVFMTEGITDGLLPSIAVSHRGLMGHIYGTATQKKMEEMATESGVTYQYPQFFLYTFPELISTTSNPAPLNKRIFINFCAMFNEKPEIEVRYAPDKEIVITEKNQPLAAYDNIKGPGSGSGPFHLAMATTGDAKASRIYTKQVLDMLKAHADVMYEGKFVDNKDFTLTSGNPLVYAKSYESENKLAVVVWNISDKESAKYEVAAASGYKFSEIAAPDTEVKLGDAIAPQSLHLLIFEK